MLQKIPAIRNWAASPKFWAGIIFRSESLFYSSLLTCLLEERFLLQLPKPFLLEDNTDDISTFNWMSYLHEDYINPIQHWIEETCNGSCHPWNDFDLLCHLHEPISDFRLALVEFPAYVHVIFDVVLFWFIAKHKRRLFSFEKMLAWLHWLYDFT